MGIGSGSSKKNKIWKLWDDSDVIPPRAGVARDIGVGEIKQLIYSFEIKEAGGAAAKRAAVERDIGRSGIT